MAFVQQRSRPVQRLQEQLSYPDDIVLPVSDSDNDWHVISSALPSTSTSSIQSFSEYSLSSPVSEDSFSDIDHLLEATFGPSLPVHDGTGIFHIPSSPTEQNHVMPAFLPTISGIRSQELIQKGSDIPWKQEQDLDSIPIHHPAGTSAILSIVWNSLQRLKDHLIENESNTLDRLSTMMSEAVLEGCLPFGSHLHMDKSLLEVE